MKFYDVFPENFFTVFTSPNKKIYAEALLVLWNVYRNSPIVTKEDLVAGLIANLENQILELEGEEGPLSLDDNLSSRAHFIIRKFLETGWLEREQDAKSFTEQFILPIYASKLLNLIYDLLHGKSIEYNGFVYSTYSILKTADEEKDEYMYDGLRQAYQLTENLENSLRELLANLRFYHQRLQDQFEVKEILEEHFDIFRAKISDKIYHPLKTFDSVPRFKARIIKIVKEWLLTPSIIEKMAETAHKRGVAADMETCRQEVILMLGSIQDTYQEIDKMLSTIDKKNSAYARASLERMQYFINTGQDSKGKLIEILKMLGKEKETDQEEKILSLITENLPLFQQNYVDEYSLYVQPRKKREHQPVKRDLTSQITSKEMEQELADFKDRLKNVFSHRKVVDYIMDQLEKQGILRSRDLQLSNDEDFVKLILAVIKADEDVPYRIEFIEDYLKVNGYRIPEMLIKRKVRNKHVEPRMGAS